MIIIVYSIYSLYFWTYKLYSVVKTILIQVTKIVINNNRVIWFNFMVSAIHSRFPGMKIDYE